MPENPHVSIIVPAHNEEAMIGKCLESVLADDYPFKEIIVVDDLSTDNTTAIAARYPVKIVRTRHKLGPSSARNFGVKYSCGEILVFLDAHSIVSSKNWLETLVRHFDDPRTGAVCGEIRGTNEESHSSFLNRCAISLFQKSRHVDPFLCSANSACRRQIFVQVGGFDKGIEWGGDIALTLKVKRLKLAIEREPEACVYHEFDATFLRRLGKIYLYGSSFPALLMKYPKYVVGRREMAFVVLGLLMTAAAVLSFALSAVFIFIYLAPFSLLVFRLVYPLKEKRRTWSHTIAYPFIIFCSSIAFFCGGLTTMILFPFKYASKPGFDRI